MTRMRLLLLLSLLTFAMAHRSMAHAETIVIRDSDFGVNGSSYAGATTTNVTGAPMRIVPVTIGHPEPGLTEPNNTSPGLLVPRSTDVPVVAPTIAVSDATPIAAH